MRVRTVIVSFLFLINGVLLFAGRELVDKICARVNGVNILHSYLQMPQISKNGELFSLEEAVAEELWVQRAVERKMVPSDTEIEKQILAIKQEYGLVGKSDEEADVELKKAIGIDFTAYRGQLKRFYAAERVKSMEFHNRCAVTAREVEEYHKAHPEIIPARYRMRLATVTNNQIKRWKNLKKTPDKLMWDEIDWVTQDELSAHLHVVCAMDQGAYSSPIKTAQGYLVVHLLGKEDRRAKTLEERYVSIEQSLRKEKLAQFAKDMEKELYEEAIVVRV